MSTEHAIETPTDERLDSLAGGELAVEQLVDEIARLTREALSPRDFHEHLLDRAVQAMAAVGGAVWTFDEQGAFREECSTSLAESESARRRGADPDHRDLLDDVVRGGRPRAFAPRGDDEGGDARNVTEFLVLAAPVFVDDRPVGVIEILQRPGLFPGVLRGHLEFLGALCDLSAEYLAHRELRSLRDQASTWRRIERFVARVHAGLDPRSTAYTIANDGRALVECDRTTVLLGRRPRVASVSGVEAIEKRAPAMRKLEKLVRVVVRSREPLWYFDTTSDLPRELEEPLQDYLEDSPARMLAVVPVWEPGTEESGRPRAIGAIVAERFDAAIDRHAFRDRVETVCLHARPALANALDHARLPLLWVNRLLGGLLGAFGTRRLPRTLALLAAVAAIVCALVFVPADFTIEGRAELQPRTRREVFATSVGIVDRVDVDHGDAVRADAPVAWLTDSELDYEYRRLVGETETALQKLDGVNAGLLATRPDTAEGRVRYNQLTSEREELRTHIAGLEEQREILERRRRELIVNSPIDGHVLTWETRKNLLGRPVEQGQPLMTVADLEGEWIVEIHVPDYRIGHVLAAREEASEPLEVEFVLATEPDVTYRGQLERIAMASDFDGEDSTVLVTVSIDKDEIAQLRPGATVVPRIHCGRRSLGFVWLHEIWESIRMRILF